MQPTKNQQGASLIEMMVSVLILSFGLLSLAGMLAFSIQMPKLSGYQMTAMSLASDYIERVRANPNQWLAGGYVVDLSKASTIEIKTAGKICQYSECTEETLAQSDRLTVQQNIRNQLPYGSLMVRCDGECANNVTGQLWIIWQEPTSNNALSSITDAKNNSDNCPTEVTAQYADVSKALKSNPRCLAVTFRI